MRKSQKSLLEAGEAAYLCMHLLQSGHARLFLSRESGVRVVEKLHGRTVRVGQVVRGELVETAPQQVHRVAHVSELHLVPVRQRNVGRAEIQMPPSGCDGQSRGGRVRSARPGCVSHVALNSR